MLASGPRRLARLLGQLEAGLAAARPSTKPSNDPSGLFGRGYAHSTVTEVLPTIPADVHFDDGMRAKYEEFQQKRRKGPSAMSQFIDLNDGGSPFQGGEEDPYTPPSAAREPVTREVDVLIIGGGFAGLLVAARLTEAGFSDQILMEKGGDFGGTWYWNRYPGVACDVESYEYMPLLEETGYIPFQSYASGFEIQEHCQRIGEFYKVYDRALFHTTVTETQWDEAAKRWTVRTNKGDAARARFVLMANGVMTQPKLANIPGMTSFQGVSFHTSRWDYSHDLRGKKVAIIGTGATACQVIPEVAKVVGELFVFQRTPSSIDVRNNKNTSAEEIEHFKKTPGWPQERRNAGLAAARFAAQGNNPAGASRRERRQKNQASFTREEINRKKEEGNFRMIERIRQRVANTVKDPATAEALKPYYVWLCKRPVFHDEYLPTFNLPHVHLVNTDGRGVERITEAGPVFGGKQYEVDVIVYATGFQFMQTGTFNEIRGRGGENIKEKWSTGTKTFLGFHVHNFPNLFIMSGPQAAGANFNFMALIEKQAEYLADMMVHMRDNLKKNVVNVTAEAEALWAEHCADRDRSMGALVRSCISYYNQEGTKRPGDLDYNGGQGYYKWQAEAQVLMKGGPGGKLIGNMPYIFE